MNGNGSTHWRTQHDHAMEDPQPGFEQAMAALMHGWVAYAVVYRERYGSSILDDAVLGDAWLRIGDGLDDLLNGELGRLDAGILQDMIHEVLPSRDERED